MPWRELFPKRRKIAIVGKSPDTRDLAPFDDTTWQIWGLNDAGRLGWLPRWDVVFQVHSSLCRGENVERDWLRAQREKVLVVSDEMPDVFRGIQVPWHELTGEFGRHFRSTVGWMLGMAILLQPEEIGIWGVNMAAASEYSEQRPNCHYFIGFARGRGIRVTMPQESTLFRPDKLYGLED